MNLLLAISSIAQQHAVDPAHRYHRIICIVHLTGSGRPDDPLRPEYAPFGTDPDRTQIIGWSSILTDDKRMAIVQFVAADRTAFANILADKRPGVLAFDPAISTAAEIETAIRLVRKDFSLDKLKVEAQ